MMSVVSEEVSYTSPAASISLKTAGHPSTLPYSAITMPSKKRKKRNKKKKAEVTPVEPQELEAVRTQELQEADSAATSKPNIFIGTLNVIAGPIRTLIDPVKKVCYPPLEEHWDTRYKNRFPKHARKLLIFDLVLWVLASALAVALVLVHTVLPPVTRISPVSVELSEPQTLTAGQPTELTIRYVSGSDELVRDAKIIVETKEDFVYTDETAAQKTTNETLRHVLHLGDLPAQASGDIHLPGIAYGTPGSTLPVLVQLTYWESGQAERTVNSVYYQIPIDDSPLQLSLEFEEPFMNDTVNQIRIDYENTGDEILRDARIAFIAPNDYRLTGARPPLGPDKEWRLGNLQPAATGSITVYGVLRSGAPPSFAIRATSTAPDDINRPLNEVRLNADAVSTGFVLSHDVSGHTSLRPGQSTDVTIRYANHGDQTIKNAEIAITASGDFLADEDIYPFTFDVIDVIAPGESGELHAPLRLATTRSQEDLNGEINPTISVTTSAEYSIEDNPARTFRTDSGVSNLPVSTTLTIDAASLYFTQAGDQLGVGPIPPQVDKTTRLWLVITIENGPNAVKNAQLTASLMPDATWTDKTSVTSGRPLAFVESDRKLIWNIGDLPAFVGGHLPRATANFEIEVAPDEKDAGEVLKLLDHIYIEGEDAYTGAKITAKGELITTSIRFGPEEALNGAVIE